MELIQKILQMISDLLASLKEGESSNILQIISDFFGKIAA